MNYVCPGCKGVSPEPKVCETEGCEFVGKPLMECACEDPAQCVCDPESGACSCAMPGAPAEPAE